MVPESDRVPDPALITAPVPEMTPVYVEALERLNCNVALFVMWELFEIEPVVPPAPMESVPALMVVMPV